MEKRVSKLQSRKKIHLIAVLCAFVTIPTITASNIEQYNWGIDKDETIKKHFPSGNYISFTPTQKPEYENKILSFILAINSEIKDRIVILRIESNPQRDFLFIRNKLYSVLENYGVLPAGEFEKLINKLSSIYKEPNIQKDKNTVTYSFYGKDTKVLVLSYEKQKLVDCKVYHYASKLFRILISE
ncbi:MAG: hypothetical protein N2316_12220 [Spirochaetes bacterium]|nr:hypothetical protein [Spirochaetota bacterium]